MNREAGAAARRQGGRRRGVENLNRGEALRDASLPKPCRIEQKMKVKKIRV